MSNPAVFRRSCAYRHAARTELHKGAFHCRWNGRATRALQRVRALRDLARDEAWLEGKPSDISRRHQFVIAVANA